MATTTRRARPTGSTDPSWLLLKAIPWVVVAAFIPTVAYNRAGGDHERIWNPLTLGVQLAMGKTVWPAGATVIVVFEVVILAAAAAVAAYVWHSWRRPSALSPAERRIDALARSMTSPGEIEETKPKVMARSSARLAPLMVKGLPGYTGLPLGRTVIGNREVRMGYEQVAVAFAGARMGKSAALAIPAICYAPGAAIVTSNRADVYTHTAGVREGTGRVWLFDVQGVTTGDSRAFPQFWFDPLDGVADLPGAAVVCDYFISAATDAGARRDAYFDGAARDLFASYVLAAALAGGDLLHVVDWLADPESVVAPVILERHGYTGLGRTMRGKQTVNVRQRDGFYDMARRFLAPLDEPRYAAAVLPPQRVRLGVDDAGAVTREAGERVHDLERFRVDVFVGSMDTVYALSQEGPGSSAAIGTALVGSILTAAQRYASGQPNDRMPVPMTVVLDEAANICRLAQLPAWYSHFGGRGIVLLTVLQSPSQGENVWGREQFKAMVDAASITWYGGNVDDESWLKALAASIGTHFVQTDSHSRGDGILAAGAAPSTSTSWHKEDVFEVRDLKALPKSRAIITIAGSAPVLVRKQFWSQTEFADQINASIKTFGAKVGVSGSAPGLRQVPAQMRPVPATPPQPLQPAPAPPTPATESSLFESKWFTQKEQ